MSWKETIVQLETPLDQIFETGGHVRVLRALVGLPIGFAASGRDIARRARVAHTTASRVLRSLTSQRLVRAQHVGRSDLYRLNDNHILAERVRALFTSEDRLRAQLIDYLRAELPHRIGAAKAAYLFGSASRGTTTPSSDIDVAIVGPKRSEADLEPELAALADKVRERFGSELNVIVDVRGRNGRRTGLWRQIERDGVSLLAGSKRG